MKISDMNPVDSARIQNTDLMAVVKELQNYKMTLGQLASFLHSNTALTGVPTAPHPTTGDNANQYQVATKGYVDDVAAARASSAVSNIWLPNSASTNGYVPASGSYPNMVWKTDGTGAPAWRADATTNPSGTTPKQVGTASVGSENAYARGDHIHPNTAPTQAYSDNSTRIATTAYVQSVFATSPNLGGNPTAKTQAATDSSTKIATTAFVKNYFAGSPTATTPSTSDNSTRIATTAYVNNAAVMKSTVTRLAAQNSKSVASGSWIAGAAITVPAGVYVISANANYPYNNGTYMAHIDIRTSSGAADAHHIANTLVTNSFDELARVRIVIIEAPTAQTTYTTYLHHNRGSALTVASHIEAVRIK